MTSAFSESAIRQLVADRVAAHAVLFKHRHTRESAPFHRDLVEAFHSTHPRVVAEAFRGAAKTTTLEETAILEAPLQEYKNCLVIGASHSRAVERLESMRHEFENNDDLIGIFGALKGSETWTASKLVLTNGVVLQALGAGQSLRGVKHHDQRPDLCLIDDLEDEESVRSPESRAAMMRWLFGALIPALTPDARIRFIGNRLDPNAVIVQVAKAKEWFHLRFPIMTQNVETGEDVATWPAMFPLGWIYEKRAELMRYGLADTFSQEYMCEADSPEARVFRPDHFVGIVKPRVRVWEATWCMVDPARSVNKRSATTAIPVWSWISNRLVVWECRIGQWMPDEIIANILEIDRLFRPVVIGIEEDALNQFILQPLRQAQAKHGQPLPLRPMAAKTFTEGRGKIDFIKSLQPFFAAHEVEFAQPMPELEAQFRSFPKGAIDAPNALAYALKMRPGAVIYDEFTQANVVEELYPLAGVPLYLALNATRAYVTAVLLQYNGRVLNILADYVDEGDPGQIAAAVVRRAALEGQGLKARLIAPPLHFEQWSNVGLRAAIAHVPAELGRGGDPLAGRDAIRGLFQGSVRGMPAIQVAHAARWTLNAFAGGYCREVRKGGVLGEQPTESVYATLMAGVESLMGFVASATGQDPDGGGNFRRSADGRLYRTTMPNRGGSEDFRSALKHIKKV